MSESHVLGDSSNNTILNNTICETKDFGIHLYTSSDNVISNNICENNGVGIFLNAYASYNVIYLNDFVSNNESSSSDYSSTNIWNSTEKITYTYNSNTYTNYLGNCWDDYPGVDDDDDDDDGIGDAPYNISGGSNQDIYPLMEPYDWEMPEPKAIYVDDDFVEDDPVNHRWNTINEGLTDAFYNDTIIVYNGTYTEYVRLNMPTRLIGIGMPVVNHSSIQISADGCTFDGFMVISGEIRVYSDENTISNNTMPDGYRGIYLAFFQ